MVSVDSRLGTFCRSFTFDPSAREPRRRSSPVSTQNFVPTPSPIRPPVRRIWASLPLASSPQVWTPLTALRFRSLRYCIIRLLLDAPSRAARTRRPCLVDGGFPPSGPQEDLTYSMSHLVVLCSCRAHQGFARSARRVRGLDPPGVLPSGWQLPDRRGDKRPSTRAPLTDRKGGGATLGVGWVRTEGGDRASDRSQRTADPRQS